MILGRKCPECGARMTTSQRFCGQCGFDTGAAYSESIESLRTALRVEVDGPEPPEEDAENVPLPTETARYTDSTDRGARVRQIVGMAAAIAASLAVIACAAVLILKMNEPVPQPEETPSPEAVHVISAATPTPRPIPTSTPARGQSAALLLTPEPQRLFPGYTDTDETVYVVPAGLNLRSGPGTGYDIVDSVTKDTALIRNGVSDNGWDRVVYNGRECYASANMLTTEAPASAAGADAPATPAPTATPVARSGKLTVTSDVNVRTGPGTEYEILGIARVGEVLTMTGMEGRWYRVTYEGQTGYVAANLVRED